MTVSLEECERRANSGLLNRWYPVVASWRLANAPIGITRLGERIAIWRDHKGQVHAVEDRCPHRGARLSLGWSKDDRIACWYHGVEVDAGGHMAAVPAIGRCEAEKRARNKAYPAAERAGTIFLWFGSPGVEPTPLVLPEELEGGEWGAILCVAHWKCNYRYALENVLDPMHGIYLHAASHSMAEGEKMATLRQRETETGFVFEKVGQTGVNFDWVELADTGAFWQRLTIPYRKNAGPGGPFGIIGMVTPVDDTNCLVFFWRCRKVDGWKRDAWRFLYRARLEQLHWHVLEQDRVILESMLDTARDDEALYAHDAGLVRLRRMFLKTAQDQIEAETRVSQPQAAV